MKIRKAQLKRIIKEELSKVLNEASWGPSGMAPYQGALGGPTVDYILDFTGWGIPARNMREHPEYAEAFQGRDDGGALMIRHMQRILMRHANDVMAPQLDELGWGIVDPQHAIGVGIRTEDPKSAENPQAEQILQQLANEALESAKEDWLNMYSKIANRPGRVANTPYEKYVNDMQMKLQAKRGKGFEEDQTAELSERRRRRSKRGVTKNESRQ